ncbi:MAG: HEAT repeat domain-containing protein [Candidatus Hermodarchaeota archaeon]
MSETRRLLLEFETEEVGIRAQKSKKVRTALVSAFSDASDVVRERALLASMDIGDPTIVVDLTKAMNDEEESVRIACAQALAFYHQPRTVPDLLRGLNDENTWVRSHCAAGLSKLLRGPIWARLSEEDIEQLVSNFPDLPEEKIRRRLTGINLSSEGIDRFLNWRSQEFNVEIDVSDFVRELEETPIVLAGAEAVATTPIEEEAPRKMPGISAEVEEILSEVPDELKETLPEEDLRRLTPETARELVDSLKASFEVKVEKPKPKKKKAVKVRKVKKVRRKKGAPSRQELIERIPGEVRESISDDVLQGLSYDELEALIASTMETAAPEVKVEKKPEEETVAVEAEVSVDEKRLKEYTGKYGEEKAQLLMTIPEDMLVGIPEEQIEEMDLETLRALLQALEPT